MIVIGIPTWVRLDSAPAGATPYDRVVMTVAIDKMNRVDVVVPHEALSDAWPSPAVFVASWKRLAQSAGVWAWAVELDRNQDSCTFHGWMDLQGDVDVARLEAEPRPCPKCGSTDTRKATAYWQCLTCGREWS